MEPTSEHDQQYWMEQFRSGEDDALVHFFKMYHKPLCYFATKLTQDKLEAEDIVSDCFVKLWERRRDFQTAQNIKAFLYISCRNACLNYIKHLKRKTTAQKSYLLQLEESDDVILHQIIEAEFLQILKQEIEELPDNCRDIFKMIYFEGKKTSELALELDLPIKTIRNRRSKAIDLLKTSFLKKGIKGDLWLFLLFFLNHS